MPRLQKNKLFLHYDLSCESTDEPCSANRVERNGRFMNLSTIDFPLTVPAIMRRAEALFGGKEIVSELPDKTLHRYRYCDMIVRAKKLAVALQRLGIQAGER